MKLLEVIENLQERNRGHIVIIKNGIFFIGVGKDALALNELLGLKLTCMKKNMCKVGFQVKSVEKYISKLEEKKKSFVIYTYDKEKEQTEELYKYTNENIEESEFCIDCSKCENKKESEQDILERVRKLGNK